MVVLYGTPTTDISDWLTFDTRVPEPPEIITTNAISSGGSRYTARVLTPNGDIQIYPRGGNFPTTEFINTHITYLAS